MGAARGTMLGAMFSGKHFVERGEDGSYFIDRDGSAFRYILNYFRNPTDFEFHGSEYERRQALDDANYYVMPEDFRLALQFKYLGHYSRLIGNCLFYYFCFYFKQKRKNITIPF